MLRILMFALLMHTSDSWVLESTHSSVQPNITENVTIRCHHGSDDNGQPRMKTVLKIAVAKQDNKERWVNYAKVYIGGTNPQLVHGGNEGVVVKGRANKVDDAFLSVTWSSSSQESMDQYSCTINGYGADDEYITVNTDPVTIEVAQIRSINLFNMIVNLKEEVDSLKAGVQSAMQNMTCDGKYIHIQEEFDSLKSGVQSAMQNMTCDRKYKHIQEELDSLKSGVQSAMQNMTSDRKYKPIQEELDSLKASVQSELQNMASQIDRLNGVLSIVKSEMEHYIPKWPGGRYALLSTVDGSPNSTDWLVGYIKFHSESSSGENRDAVSNHSLFASPILERGNQNFFYIRTRKRVKDSAGPAWPKGSYCLHRVGSTCPRGFKLSIVRLDAEDDDETPVDVFNAPDYEAGIYEYIYFCCRQDGRHDKAISLPVTEPFFLYRFKGQCQKVKFATVTEEWFQIDTENVGNSDRCDPSHRPCPDSTFNPARFQLCYYRGLG